MARVTSGPVRVNVGPDESYIFDRSKLMLSDLFMIKSASGLNGNALLQGIGEADPAALQALVWFLRYKDGRQEHITTVEFVAGLFEIEPIDEDEGNPTEATTSETSETATSDDSPTIST